MAINNMKKKFLIQKNYYTQNLFKDALWER